MSRIHDALKKAEEERATLAGGVATSTEPEHAAEEPRARKPLFAGDNGTTLPDVMRFNELKQKCAHPHWKLDSNANVFVEGGRASLAAEQFRTLRSRLYQIRESKPLKTIVITSAVAGTTGTTGGESIKIQSNIGDTTSSRFLNSGPESRSLGSRPDRDDPPGIKQRFSMGPN